MGEDQLTAKQNRKRKRYTLLHGSVIRSSHSMSMVMEVQEQNQAAKGAVLGFLVKSERRFMNKTNYRFGGFGKPYSFYLA